MNKSELKNLSKIELEKLGRTKGVELDRRFNKKTLIEQLTGLFAKESTTEAPVEVAPPVVRVSFGDRYKALKNR
tara:strand:- start:2497 stop:2718 length:222 start_codon:yes stop_codon:yes gene_type:complete